MAGGVGLAADFVLMSMADALAFELVSFRDGDVVGAEGLAVFLLARFAGTPTAGAERRGCVGSGGVCRLAFIFQFAGSSFFIRPT